MNWLQKISSPSYYDIGFEGRPGVLWWWDGTGIQTEIMTGEYEFHDGTGYEAFGRIEMDKQIGTIFFFDSDKPERQKQIIDELITKFSGIRFVVETWGGGQIPLQKYYEEL